MERRNFLSLLAAGSLSVPFYAEAASLEVGSYAAFLQSVRQQAAGQGVADSVLEQALGGLRTPNEQVLIRQRHQPEFTLTWAQYRARVLGPERFAKGVTIYHQVQPVLDPLAERYGCNSSIIMGIWGLESSFGVTQGKFNVIDALATLGFASHRKSFFRSELLKALAILGRGDIAPEQMMGSYAGAMGQPQFMPSAYLYYAVDGDGDGKSDIWNSQPDVFASIAHYIGSSGWKRGQLWGEEVVVPLGENGQFLGPAAKNYRQAQPRAVSEWASMGVTRPDGSALDMTYPEARLIQPDGSGTDAFLLYPNFRAIRAYNPSDFYALAVGILGQRSTETRE